jgi:hypothetical protein
VFELLKNDISRDMAEGGRERQKAKGRGQERKAIRLF